MKLRPKIERVALHESAHAVAALAVGCKLHSLTIVPQHGGRIQGRSAHYSGDDDHESGIIHMAGPAWERHWRARARERRKIERGTWGDWRDARALAAGLSRQPENPFLEAYGSPDPIEQARLVRDWAREAYRIVRANRKAIERVAARLLIRRSMTHAEVVAAAGRLVRDQQCRKL